MNFQLTSEDFNYYDYIFGMDDANMKDLNRKAPKGSKAKLLLFGDFDPKGDRIIRDPYYVCSILFTDIYLIHGIFHLFLNQIKELSSNSSMLLFFN